MLMLVKRRLFLVVGMLLRAGIVVSRVQMKRSMGVAADESERHQQNDAAHEQGPLHGTITFLRRVGKGSEFRIAQDRLSVKPDAQSA